MQKHARTTGIKEKFARFLRVASQARSDFEKLAAASTANRPKTRTPLRSRKRAYFDIKGRNFAFNWTKSLRAKKAANKDGRSAFLLCRWRPPGRSDIYMHIQDVPNSSSVCLSANTEEDTRYAPEGKL